MHILISLFVIAAGIITAGAVVIYAIESPHEESQIQTWLDAFWWSVATATTVGYGDVVPVTELGRAISLIYMFFGIGLIATFLSVFGTTFYKKRFQRSEELSHGHTIILRQIESLEKKINEHSKILKEIQEKLENNETKN